MVYTTEKTLKDAGEKVPSDLKTKIEDKVKELKEILAKDDFDNIKTKTEELSQSLQEIGTYLYKQEASKEKDQSDKKEEKSKNSEDNKDAKDADFEEK